MVCDCKSPEGVSKVTSLCLDGLLFLASSGPREVFGPSHWERVACRQVCQEHMQSACKQTRDVFIHVSYTSALSLKRRSALDENPPDLDLMSWW